VGPYLGLVPKQEDSGESQPQLGISKAGDTMLDKLLVGSAQYIFGPFGPDTDLRRYGQRLCECGGKNARVYEPLGYAAPATNVQDAAA
jgi:transposase